MTIELYTNNPTCWEILPDELLEKILDIVEDPILTVKVSKKFQNGSTHAYRVLLKQYATTPSLKEFVPLPHSKFDLTPTQKVQMIYQAVTIDVKNCRIDLKTVEPGLPPLSPCRLVALRKLIQDRLNDKAKFYRAIFCELAQNIGRGLSGKTPHDIIKIAENTINRFSEIFELAYMLNLKNLGLTHLPSQIWYLKDLVSLNLNYNQLTVLPPELKSLTGLMTLQISGNPLSTESVKDICSTLPRLKNVTIDSEQPSLIELFETSFPLINVTVTRIIRVEEPI